MQLKILFQTIRPSFLIITPICIFLGLSLSISQHAAINSVTLLTILLGATFAHISVNTLNEYYDFKSGLDLITSKTAFSGGSGALPNHPEMAKPVFILGIASLIITIVIGLHLISISSSKIIPIGIVGILLIVTYTKWINRSPILCLLAPGLAFGVLMVIGTYLIISGKHSAFTWLLSLVPFFLVNNLLLLNQYPDIKADASVGRNTFPIAFGIEKSNFVYAVFFGSAYLLILLLIIKGYLPILSTIALFPMVLSLFTLIGMIKTREKIGDHSVYLSTNVAATILTPLLLGISIIYGNL